MQIEVFSVAICSCLCMCTYMPMYMYMDICVYLASICLSVYNCRQAGTGSAVLRPASRFFENGELSSHHQLPEPSSRRLAMACARGLVLLAF